MLQVFCRVNLEDQARALRGAFAPVCCLTPDGCCSLDALTPRTRSTRAAERAAPKPTRLTRYVINNVYTYQVRDMLPAIPEMSHTPYLVCDMFACVSVAPSFRDLFARVSVAPSFPIACAFTRAP